MYTSGSSIVVAVRSIGLADRLVLTVVLRLNVSSKVSLVAIDSRTTFAVWTVVHMFLFGHVLGPAKLALFPAPGHGDKHARRAQS